MGYRAKLIGQQFYIASPDKRTAFLAAKPQYGQWVHKGDTDGCRDLVDVLNLWGWEATENDAGHIIKLDFTNEKLGDEVKVWCAIAPWVKAGSYLEMSGEEGHLWRWCFNGTTCTEQTPTLTW